MGKNSFLTKDHQLHSDIPVNEDMTGLSDGKTEKSIESAKTNILFWNIPKDTIILRGEDLTDLTVRQDIRVILIRIRPYTARLFTSHRPARKW